MEITKGSIVLKKMDGNVKLDNYANSLISGIRYLENCLGPFESMNFDFRRVNKYFQLKLIFHLKIIFNYFYDNKGWRHI